VGENAKGQGLSVDGHQTRVVRGGLTSAKKS
jgi:hypothetical protein